MAKKLFIISLLGLFLIPLLSLAANPFHGSYGDDEDLPVINGQGGVWNLMQGGADGQGGLNVIQGVVYEKEDQFEPLPLTVFKIIKAFLQLLGVIFLIIIVYAGFRWMTAGGNEEQVTEAKKLIKNGIIGLIIMLVAYAITLFVFGAIIGDNFLSEY